MNEVPTLEQLDRQGITDGHRLAIAHCVMEWAKCESILRAVLSATEERNLDDGAQSYSRMSPEEAWKNIKRAMRKRGATAAVLGAIQRNRESSRVFYETRKLIVHAGCIGVWKRDTRYLMFAPFESEKPSEMSIYWVPIEDLTRSSAFARSAAELGHRILSTLGY